MADHEMREEEVFERARHLAGGSERRAYLARACSNDPHLLCRVEALLRAEADANDFFEESSSALRSASTTLSCLESPGDQIGHYKILAKIGEGGCGVVYRAEQLEPLRRRVALKVIKSGMDTLKVIARFEGERQALAMMDHPHIARIYDAGATERGRPFFVMELVHGKSITSFCDEQRSSIEARLRLFVSICHAVQHAHQKGVIHRDLKPTNLLVSLEDGVAVPKIIDFGIAKAIEGRLGPETEVTGVFEFLGTPAYLSPEQANRSFDLDTRSDLYTLGVLLYELLTGRTPVGCEMLLTGGLDEMRKAISSHDAPPPSVRVAHLSPEERSAAAAARAINPGALAKELRGDLDAIVAKSLEKVRQRRYQTAHEFAADLERYLAREPVLARPAGRVYRARKWVQRNRVSFVASAAVLVAVTASGAIVFQKTREGRRIATQSVIALRVSNGSRLLDEGDHFAALREFTEALRLEDGNAARQEAHRIRIGSLLEQCPKLVGVFPHDYLPTGAIFSPDERQVLTCAQDRKSKVWDLHSARLLFTLVHSGPVYKSMYTPDGRRILTMSGEGIRFWKSENGEPLSRGEIVHLPRDTAPLPCFDPDGKKLLTLVTLKTAQIWDTTTGHAIGPELLHNSTIHFFAFSPGGKFAVTLCEDKHVRVWDSQSGQLRGDIPDSSHPEVVRFSPDDRRLVVVGGSRKARAWNLETLRKTDFELEAQNGLEWITTDPFDERLLSISWDRSVQIWDEATGEPLGVPIGHDLPVYTTRFSPDGRFVFTYSGGNLLQMFHASSGRLIAPIFRHSFWRDPVSISASGRFLATIHGNIAEVWDLYRPQSTRISIQPVPFFQTTATSPSGRLKARIGGDNSIRIWNLQTADPMGPAIRQSAPFKQVAFATDEEMVVTENGDTRARVWDARNAQPLTPLLETRFDLRAPPLRREMLTHDAHSLSDLRLLSSLLSNTRMDASGSKEPLEASESYELFHTLRQRYPAALSITASDREWHEQQATQAQQEWNWRAALFHLERLLKLDPSDQKVLRRKNYATLALERALGKASDYRHRLQVIPPRDPSAPGGSVDLTSWFNGSIKGVTVSFPSGIQSIGGTPFDLRGVIRLASAHSKLNGGEEPETVAGISVGQKCHKLRFLHGADDRSQDGVTVAHYVMHYANGVEKSWPIVYGNDVRDYWTHQGEPFEARDSEIVWFGTNGVVEGSSRTLRVFLSTWTNPLPEEPILAIDVVSDLTASAPMLFAVTAE